MLLSISTMLVIVIVMLDIYVVVLLILVVMITNLRAVNLTFAKATVAALRAALEENPEVALFNFDN